MRVLLAAEFAPNRFRRVLTARVRKDGRLSLSPKWSGTIESFAVRTAARMIAGDPAIQDVDAEYGSRTFRTTRIA